MTNLNHNNDPIVHSETVKNFVNDFTERAGGRILCIEGAVVTGTGTVTSNIFQVTGSVEILKTWAIIKTITTLTNLTDMGAFVYDGTNTVKLTNYGPGGAVLSGATVGTFFTKDKDSSNAFTVSLADQVRILESTNDRNIQLPFVVTQKNGSDTFIGLSFVTTDNPVSFTIDIFFEWRPLNGGTLTEV